MPQLGDLLKAGSILYRAKAQTAREVLEQMTQNAAAVFGVDASNALEHAIARENLGGTGIGEGVAVPHARLNDLKGPIGVFALLDEAVDFEAPDGRGADLVFLLLSPEDSGAVHLKALAKITRVLRSAPLRASLRAARSKEAIFAILTHAETEQVA